MPWAEFRRKHREHPVNLICGERNLRPALRQAASLQEEPGNLCGSRSRVNTTSNSLDYPYLHLFS
jgi:hypothetical protein